MRRRTWLALALLLAGWAGCSPYYNIYQFDAYRNKPPKPGEYKRVAVLFSTASDKNKLFLEAMSVELMKRGFDVVEREKMDKLIGEQQLAKGDFANLSDREKAVRLGKLLNADLVFYGDALINRTYYQYETTFIGRSVRGKEASLKRSVELQDKANTSGVVEGISDPSFAIKGFYDVGVTAHAVDTATGEIVWVGYRLLASCVNVSGKDPTALNSFAVVCKVCSALIDDFMGLTPKKTEDKASG